VVGTVDDAVEQIVEWSAAGAIDGFLAAPGGSVESLHCVLEQLVPAWWKPACSAPLHRHHVHGAP
jgi:alkanesulfonate monooxygenase SsuD/methylene tetrahydromethanopterin reductase-like flavin-dependent oxidoreductase (luciferase family)